MVSKVYFKVGNYSLFPVTYGIVNFLAQNRPLLAVF